MATQESANQFLERINRQACELHKFAKDRKLVISFEEILANELIEELRLQSDK